MLARTLPLFYISSPVNILHVLFFKLKGTSLWDKRDVYMLFIQKNVRNEIYVRENRHILDS
jgi:hypothetical protein